MSDFGNFIKAQIKAQETTGAEMANRMCIDRAHFSSFINGRRTSCNVETLMTMVRGISPSDNIQAGLLEAYFRDQCVEKYKPWVRVVASSDSSNRTKEDAAEYLADDPIVHLSTLLRRLSLPTGIVEAFSAIAMGSEGRKKFQVVIQDLGKFAKDELLAAPADHPAPAPGASGAPVGMPTGVPKHVATPMRTVGPTHLHGSSTAGAGGLLAYVRTEEAPAKGAPRPKSTRPGIRKITRE